MLDATDLNDLTDTFRRALADIIRIQRSAMTHDEQTDAIIGLYDVPRLHQAAVIAAMAEKLARGKRHEH